MSLPRPKPRPRVTLKQRLAGLGIAILICVALPLFGLWLYLCQPSLSRNRPSEFQADAVRLEKWVRLLSETHIPRDFAHRDNLKIIADLIAEDFEKNGAKVVRQSFRSGGLFQFQNVSGSFGPLDTNLPRVIVGAHYDAYKTFPGADDNASGVAGILELARLLGQVDAGVFQLPVELVCWPLEEPPHFGSDGMGSAKHAKALKESGKPVRLMISLETIGYFSDESGSQSYPSNLLHLFYPNRGNFIALVGDLHQRDDLAFSKAAMRGSTPLPVHSISAPRAIPGIDFSDHLSFWRNGYPAIMVTDTAFYRNDRYHTERDTPDTLDYERMSLAVVATFELIRQLALPD